MDIKNIDVVIDPHKTKTNIIVRFDDDYVTILYNNNPSQISITYEEFKAIQKIDLDKILGNPKVS